MPKKLKAFLNPHEEIKQLREEIKSLQHENQKLSIEVRILEDRNRVVGIKLAAFCETLMPEYEAVAVHRGTGEKIRFSNM